MPDEQPRGGAAPVLNQAIEREFNALRAFLAQLEQDGTGPAPTAHAGAASTQQNAVSGGTSTSISDNRRQPATPPAVDAPRLSPWAEADPARSPRPATDHVVYWWVVVRWVTVLPTLAALRERLAALPGAIAAQVVDISSRETRLGVVTTPQVTREQLEFAVTACHDIPAAEIMLRTPRRVS